MTKAPCNPSILNEAQRQALAERVETGPIPAIHAVVLLDQADWPLSGDLPVPANITLLSLPPKCSELTPVENILQFMRENWLSNRVFTSHEDIISHWRPRF
ncbi:IS630 family transposase [Pararhodospirillum photometricum]|uniref:ISSod10, transposase OrfB n=1 Tax=Pararhodospirillum photometricum DSM 122 TaxID=1150469 RepID=H6SL54_PARPM|nr:ISSod10, transposase OrfB [Pararhodospirillum photometricum DSM 122]